MAPKMYAPRFRRDAVQAVPLNAHRIWRIVHVVPTVDPSHGGPPNVVVRLAAAQASLGHEVTIVSSLTPAHRSDFEQSVAAVPGFERVRLLLAPWTAALDNWFGRRLTPIFRSLLPFADVVHIHGIWEQILLTAAREARRAKVPYIVRPCGMLDAWCMSQHALRKSLAMRLAHGKMLNNAATFHSLNLDESRLMGHLKLLPPHTIIPNGVFLDEVDDESGDALFERAVPWLGKQRFILFLGRINRKKGVDFLAAAFRDIAKAHPGVDLVMVGPPDNAEQEFQETIRAAGLQKRVHTIGPLYGPAKFAAFRRAACFCLPSRQEGFSLAITEALASRTPVAISTECHFPEVATAGAGVVFPLRPEEVTSGLSEILKATPRECERMGDAGRTLVERHYTWQRVAEQTLAAYASVSRTKPAAIK